ncbi:MAG: hypothetical protein II614_04935 [Ruminococcus sp.]|nr:DUF6512 family protein [uncultured Ruminococcus sp.]MBQ1616664.1 hypothetical protein [Ruminococcus sp.]MBQ4170938.1 hypothetical protein [Ruminococcus sp.]
MPHKHTKYLTELEMGGILFCFLVSVLMKQLYALTDGHLIGVLFGAVNNSVWEQTKTLLLPYLLWGLLELLSVQPSMKRLTAAKTLSLYLLGGLLCGGGLLLRPCGAAANTAFSLAAVTFCSLFSLWLYRSPLYLKNLFAPCVLLLFLFVSLYFSFTPFPPQLALFRDDETGMFGIIPIYMDKGAVILDALAERISQKSC